MTNGTHAELVARSNIPAQLFSIANLKHNHESRSKTTSQARHDLASVSELIQEGHGGVRREAFLDTTETTSVRTRRTWGGRGDVSSAAWLKLPQDERQHTRRHELHGIWNPRRLTKKSSLIWTIGALTHAPRHSTSSNVKRPSLVVSGHAQFGIK